MPYPAMYTSLAAGSTTTAAGAAASSAVPAMGSAVPMFAIAGAIIGGTLGGYKAAEQNEYIRESVRNAYKAINKNIGENRLAFYDATDTSSRASADILSQAQLSLSGFGSGISSNELIAQMRADQEYDQVVRARSLEKQEENFAIQKENVYASGKAQSQDVAMAIVGGALSMGAAGAQLGGGIDSLRLANANSEATKLFYNDMLKNPSDPTNIARIQAINAGVPAYKLVGDNNPLLQPFITSQATQNIQKSILESNLSLSQLQLGAQKQINTIPINYIDRYNNMGQFAAPRDQGVNGLLNLINTRK